MSHSLRPALALGTAAILGLGLSACSLLPFGNSTSAFNMKVGQCIQIPDGDRVSSFETAECTAEHDGEVYHTLQLTDSTLPSDSEMEDKATSACSDAFEDYVGTPYEESALEIYWTYPTSQTWSRGDREIVCIATPTDSSKLTQSVKGSKM